MHGDWPITPPEKRASECPVAGPSRFSVGVEFITDGLRLPARMRPGFFGATDKGGGFARVL
jgi:hypothetical protein